MLSDLVATNEHGAPVEIQGSCSLGYVPLLVPILVMGAVVIIAGNICIYISRNDEEVNKEVLYIGLAQLNVVQVLLLGIVLMADTNASSFQFMYNFEAAVEFMIFGGILILIFLPKVLNVAGWSSFKMIRISPVISEPSPHLSMQTLSNIVPVTENSRHS